MNFNCQRKYILPLNLKLALNMHDNSAQANYSKSIVVHEYKVNLSQRIVNKVIRLVNKFAFIDLSQWILLFLLNAICLIFVVFACMWID